MRSVDISRYNSPATAECEQCDRVPPDATRARCHLHVRQTGHTVRFVIEDTTVYTETRNHP